MDNFIENHNDFMKSNKLTLKLQQRFRSEKHIFFTEEVNKIAWIANDDKKIPPIDSTETYGHRINTDLACTKEKIKCNNIIKQYKND